MTAPPVSYRPHRHPAVNFYTWNGVAAATRRKHAAILSRFLAYVGLPSSALWAGFSVRGDDVLEWLAVSADLVQADTVLNWMGSLRAALMDLRVDTSFFDTREFALFRQGVKRVKGQSAPRSALPITLPILSRINYNILGDVTIPVHERLLLATGYAVAFACFLRLGELAYDTFDPMLHLQRKDVLFTTEGTCLRIKGSKMDPSRKGVTLPLPRIGDAALRHVCPSTLLRMLLTASAADGDAPLFNFSPYGSPCFDAKRLIREARNALITSGFSVSDMDGRVFSGHSFRRGAVTWAARLGVADRDIMRLGRWSTRSIPGGHQRYIEFTMRDHRDLISSLYNAQPRGSMGRCCFDLGGEELGEVECEDDGLPPR